VQRKHLRNFSKNKRKIIQVNENSSFKELKEIKQNLSVELVRKYTLKILNKQEKVKALKIQLEQQFEVQATTN